MKVINFHGAPCSGKSIMSSELHAFMGKRGLRVELIIERSKELIYENNLFGLKNEIGIFAEKWKRIKRHEGNVDFLITDSPLLNSVYYGKFIGNHFVDFVEIESGKFDNVFFQLDRRFPYDPRGRNPNEAEGIAAFQEIDKFVTKSQQPVFNVTGISVDDLYHRYIETMAKV